MCERFAHDETFLADPYDTGSTKLTLFKDVTSLIERCGVRQSVVDPIAVTIVIIIIIILIIASVFGKYRFLYTAGGIIILVVLIVVPLLDTPLVLLLVLVDHVAVRCSCSCLYFPPILKVRRGLMKDRVRLPTHQPGMALVAVDMG